MRGVSGTESLLVCLSKYLPLCCVYILHDSSLGYFFRKEIKHRIGEVPLLVVYEASFSHVVGRYWVGIGHDVVCGVIISMKSIDMYIGHDSSLVVCFSNNKRILRKVK